MGSTSVRTALVVLALGSLAAACSSASSTAGTGGASSSSHATTGSSTTATGSSSSHATSSTATASVAATTGTSGGCMGSLDFGPKCNACMDASCCAEEMACSADANCVLCLEKVTPSCASGATFAGLAQCLSTSCASDCEPITPPAAACDPPAVAPSNGTCITVGGMVKCNPITNEGCDASKQEVCDSGGVGAYACFPPPPPSSQDLCQDCSSKLGFCKSGATCIGVCYKLCCDDGDCGTGHCDKSHAQYQPAGVCAK